MKEKLYRSQKEKIIGGVAGGLAEYFEVDPVLIRISFVAATFISGIGIIAYILLWIIVPQNPVVLFTTPNAAGAPETSGDQTFTAGGTPQQIVRPNRGTSIIGVTLIVLGGLLLADNIFPFFNFDHFWPLLLIVLGAGLLLKSSNKN